MEKNVSQRESCVDIARTVAREVLARHADDVDREGRWPAESIAALAEVGLLGMTVPSAFGGAGQGPLAFASVVSALAQQCASTAMIYLMHTCATQVIVAVSDFPQRATILRAISAGKHLSTLAFSERGSRSHFWAPLSQVLVNGDKHQLSAEKSFVTSAGMADSYIVNTRSIHPAVLTDQTLYLVPRDIPGLSVAGAWNGLGLRGNASAPLRLESVTVPASYRIGADGAGFTLMMNAVLPWFQLGSAAVSVGIARAATIGIRGHLLESKLEHLGQSLADLPNLRARLAQMQIAVDMQQAFMEQVAGLMENPGPATLAAVLEVKAAAAEACLFVTDLAMRTGGGACFGRRSSVERNFRDARAASVMAPTTDVLHDFIGRALLDMPLF
jgi:alkylation response protein AidB-like acyl-CoA dehydrogenase